MVVERLLSLWFATIGRFNQGEDNDFLAGQCANVVVEADWIYARDVPNDFF